MDSRESQIKRIVLWQAMLAIFAIVGLMAPLVFMVFIGPR